LIGQLALLCLLALAAPSRAQDGATAPDDKAAQAQWAFETSDIELDPEFRFGRLDNGMRFILRHNATPQGTALVRLHIGSGSLDETDSERGLAHFLEHMAFNGSTRIAEGEMIRLLEREGLEFGADTNATTSFETTVYKLNLPRNDKALLDTALMLMREIASELLIEEQAVDRERGVILSERRDRRNFAYKEIEDRFAFVAPGARYLDRFPVGELENLETATAADVRRLYRRLYVPANATIIVVGDFDVAEMETLVRDHFSDWQGNPDPVKPETGPIDIARSGATDIYLDDALDERVQLMRFTAWVERPDSAATRRANVLRQIGYAIINRRLQSLARGADAPFRGAGFGTSEVFEDARLTSLIIDTEDGGWQRGLEAAAVELRRALEFGFSEAEVQEQLARIRTALEDGASGSATRTNASLVSAALDLLDDDRTPSTPESALARFEDYAAEITAESALAAVLDDAAPLNAPLIRFQGRAAPEGGELALRTAWDAAASVAIAPPLEREAASFAYTDFGEAGEVVSDTRDDRFDFRLIRFANGVRLNLKQTDINKDRVSFRLTLDGGQLLETREEPLKTALVSTLPLGGLGAHSQDELETILAGRSVRLAISSQADAFRMSGSTTPRDLELQLQLLAAALTDPGYRPEGEERYQRSVQTFFASLDATPAEALSNSQGAILSDSDPRFSLQPREAYEQLTFAQLARDIGDRLQHGAIELALVGDFDEQAAIRTVASSLGALPLREPEFQPREAARQRPFTTTRGLRTITHSGESDQALVRMVWPTTDDSDFAVALRLEVLERIVQIKLQERLREDLGKSYSPSSSSSTSSTYRGYGTFTVTASIDVAEVEPTREAIRTMLEDLRSAAIDQDTLDRARQPLIERYDNLLKSLGGWMTLADRAQSESDRLDRFIIAKDLLQAIGPDELRDAALQYLAPDEAVEILVLPKTAADAG